MYAERTGVVTFKGGPLTLLGPEVKPGDEAPDFELRRGLAPDTVYTLATERGKTRLLSVVPSLDTPVCDLQGRRFNEEAAKLGKSVSVVIVSVDLPPAQERWCGAAGVDQVMTASDYYDHSFGLAYGLRIEELGLLARAVILLDPDGMVRYVQVVPELTELPNFEAALVATRTVVEEG
jgi:thiol peroxidase